MENHVETTGDIEKKRRDAQAILERQARRRGPGAERDLRIRERAWELFRDRVRDVGKGEEGVGYNQRVSILGKECLAQATIFEDAVDQALGDGAGPVPEVVEEDGQPFGPALRPSERGQGVIGQKDVPRLDPSAAEVLAVVPPPLENPLA